MWTTRRQRDRPLCTQPVAAPAAGQLNLSRRFHGNIPVELTGGTAFPNIGLRPYLLTLPGYGSYWFSIVSPGHPCHEPGDAHVAKRRPRFTTVGTSPRP